MPTDLDMSRYVGLFVAEAAEHLEALSRDLVTLERQRTPETVDSLFRHAHSVKGMAASMGLEAIATLAHRVEDLVEALRNDTTRWDRALVDLMLEATDTMQAQVRAAAESQTPAPPSDLLGRLAEAVRARTGQGPKPTRVARNVLFSAGAPAPPPSGAEPLELHLQVATSAGSPGGRAFMAYRTLASLGTVLDIQPPLEELRAGALPEGRFRLGVQVLGGEHAVREALKRLPEVELVSVGPHLDAPALAA
ncbi:MAG: Hpt domain-containing protein, partial [Myxococcaceae bacterium]